MKKNFFINKLKDFCSAFIFASCAVILILTILFITFKPADSVVHVLLISKQQDPLHVTNNKFLSIALDSVLIAEGFRYFNLTNPSLVKLMAPLAPGYLRIGGNMADRLWFSQTNEFTFKSSSIPTAYNEECSNENTFCDVYARPNFTMSGVEWLQLNKLAIKSGFTILFDLNCLIRYPNGSWNSKNAEELIDFSNKHHLNVIWELGNEPNAFRHVFDYEVNATQLATDFKQLRNILNRYSMYRSSLLVGPDTTRPTPKHKESVIYLRDFLQKAHGTINATTWHQYYFNGKTSTIKDFLDPSIFDILLSQITTVKEVVASVGAQTKPIWLGETSSAYGGGVPNCSDRFVSTFIWLDKLGLAAREGLDVVIRQSFFGGNYSLVDINLEPLPDWWLSVLYKQLVGPEVIPCYLETSNKVRLYCHCTKNNSFHYYSSIIIYGFNLNDVKVSIKIDNYVSHVLEYILSSNGNLQSKKILLNGKPLHLLSDGSLPKFEPKIVSAKPYLSVPSYSLAFWVVPIPLKTCSNYML